MPTYDIRKNVNEEYSCLLPDFRENDGHAAKFRSSIFIEETPSFDIAMASRMIIDTSMSFTVGAPGLVITGPHNPETVASTGYMAFYAGQVAKVTPSTSENQFRFGNATDAGAPMTTWMPFLNVAIAQGTPILSAILTVFAKESQRNIKVVVKVAFEDTDDAITPTGFQDLISKPQTENRLKYAAPSWTDLRHYTFDITSSLNQVIGRTGWVSGNDVAVLFKDNGSTNNMIRTFHDETVSGYEPFLTVIW